MPTTTPPEIAPLLWVLGGPWHGRRILHPGRTTAFELALVVLGEYRIYTYTFRASEPPNDPIIFADGWQREARRDGWWEVAGHRRGVSESHDVRYLYREPV